MDFIRDFVEATAGMASPERFRRWTGIVMVSAAASRRVWTVIESDKKLFPNLFVWLVSPPGIGKTRPMLVGKELLKPLKHVRFSPDEVTRQRVIEQMGDVFTEGIEEGDATYLLWIREVATFLPEVSGSWLQAVADLWDCPPEYEKQIKTPSAAGRTGDFIVAPYMVWIAGAQPAWFASGMPASSYEMGLPARTFYIYEEKKPERKLFTRKSEVQGLDALSRALVRVSQRQGEVRWTPEAEAAFQTWMDEGLPPVVDDPLLTGYNTRRDCHVAKVALLVALGRNHGKIELEDLKTAQEIVFDAEVDMPKALRNAGGNIHRMKEEAVVAFIITEWNRTKKPVPERAVRRRLSQMVSSLLVTPIINELIAQGRVKPLYENMNQAPNRLLKPGTAA